MCGSRRGGIIKNGVNFFLPGDSEFRIVDEVAIELGVEIGVSEDNVDEDFRFNTGDSIWVIAFRFNGETGDARSGSGDDTMCCFLGVISEACFFSPNWVSRLTSGEAETVEEGGSMLLL
jgi:hypothetical protein